MAQAPAEELNGIDPRESRIEELTAELNRIRSNRMGFFYSGFLWGTLLGVIAMGAIPVAVTLPVYDILGSTLCERASTPQVSGTRAMEPSSPDMPWCALR